MATLNLLLTIIYIFCCLFLGFVVLIQKGEGSGLGGAFGAGGGAVDKAFGAKADMTWKRATAVAASLFMILAIVLGILQGQLQKGSIASRVAEEQRAKDAAEKAAAEAGEQTGENAGGESAGGENAGGDGAGGEGAGGEGEGGAGMDTDPNEVGKLEDTGADGGSAGE